MSSAPPAAALRPRRRHAVDLVELFDGRPAETATGPGTPSAPVSGITLSSTLVRPGDLYVALPGRRHHGAEFAGEAAAGGAVAVLTDRDGAARAATAGLPVYVAEDPRAAMAGLAARVYGEPARALTMYAVTGTNGKTTTTFLLEAALRAAGHRTGLVGTVGFRLDGAALDAVRTTVTTPESTELQALLAYLREAGADSVVMEVSSHAMVLRRADAIVFDVAAFTNLGRDHLDFHGDVESYFRAKASLFTGTHTRRAVVNVDDAYGRRLVAEAADDPVVAVTTLSLDGPADVMLREPLAVADGRTQVRAVVCGRPVDFALALPGDFNVRNALTALAMLALTGVDLDRAAEGLAQARVPGRMELVDLGPGAPRLYVDFAHTPQAVAAALAAVGRNRCVVVLGCGGDRDPEKRRPMGEAAAHGADLVLVTDDNPRSEPPEAIRAELLAGARAAVAAGARATEVLDGGDRRKAIRRALELAGADGVVAVLGKGHESGQEVGGAVLPFRDGDVAAEEWARLQAGADAATAVYRGRRP